MDAKIRNALVKEFAAQLNAQLPQFIEDHSQAIPIRRTLYSWRFNERLSFYILLTIHQYEDSFTIDLGWSTTHQYPPHGGRLPTDAPRDGGLTFRLYHLMGLRRDQWWHLGREQTLSDFLLGTSDLPREEKLSRIKPQVTDAIQSLVKYAIPYFQQVAREQGHATDAPDVKRNE